MQTWSNPIEVLPTMSLTEPQRWPEGRPYAPWDAPQNVTHQFLARQLIGGTGGRGGRTKVMRLFIVTTEKFVPTVMKELF